MANPFDLDNETFKDLAWWAERKGMELNVFAIKALRDAMPANVNDLRTNEEVRAAMIDKAHDEADKVDEAEATGERVEGGESLITPEHVTESKEEEAPPPQKTVPLQRGGPKKRFVAHSCFHCDTQAKPQAFPGAIGTCGAAERAGMPCQFPSGVAGQCDYYAPRRAA